MYSDDEILELAAEQACRIAEDPSTADAELSGLLGADVVHITDADHHAHDLHVTTAHTLLQHALHRAGDHPYADTWTFELGVAYALRAEHTSSIPDWDTAVTWMDRGLRQTLARWPAGPPTDGSLDDDLEDLATRLVWAHHHRTTARLAALDESALDTADREAEHFLAATEKLLPYIRSAANRAPVTALVGHAWAVRHDATEVPTAIIAAITALSTAVPDLPPDGFAAVAYEELAELLGRDPDRSIEQAVTAATRAVELSTPDDPNLAYRHWLLAKFLDTRLTEAEHPDPRDRDQLIESLTLALNHELEPWTALTLGTHLAGRAKANDDIHDLRKAIRWLRAAAISTEVPTEDAWLFWSELTDTCDSLARLTNTAEDWAQVITYATTTLDCAHPAPADALGTVLTRLLALHNYSSDFPKAVVAEFPMQRLFAQSASVIMAAAGDPDVDSEFLGFVAGYHAMLDMWAMSEAVSLAETSEPAQFVLRARPLIDLGMKVTESLDEDWGCLLDAVAGITDMIDRMVVRRDGPPTLDRLVRSTRSAVDPGLRASMAEITTVMAGIQGTRTGSLASIRAATRRDRPQSASPDTAPDTSTATDTMTRFLEFVGLALSRPSHVADQADFDGLVHSFAQSAMAQAGKCLIPIVILAKNLASVERTGDLAQDLFSSPHVPRSDDPWYPMWSLSHLVSRLLRAIRTGRASEIQDIRVNLDRLRDVHDTRHDIVAMFMDMLFSIADAQLVAVEPADHLQLQRAIEGQKRTLEFFRKASSTHVDTFAKHVAELLRRRGGPGDHAESRELSLEVVSAVTWRVLVQSGTEDAITVARGAVAEIDELVTWCFEDTALDELVRLLDAQRGLVLHAANTNRSVAQQLVATGEAELAAKWVAAAGDERVELPGMSGADALPTDLRARVLRTLSERGTVLTPPSVAEIQDALRAHGSDVLIYLVAATSARSGMAVAVPRKGAVAVAPLGGLTTEAVARYVETYTAWQDAQGDERVAARKAWQSALDELCDWAWRAAGAEILRLGRTFAPGREPRIVLTPMGLLGLVPWHAARRPAGAVPRYLLHDGCVSYTPSARMLCEVTSRQPVTEGDVALVGDPAENLYFGGHEAKTLRDSFYPKARFLGGVGKATSLYAPREPAPDGEGTPEQVADLLLRRPAMVHFACHATAKVDAPQESYLQLAGGRRLAAGALLDLNPTDGLPIGLATLAGCTTSLSGVDYDEALSLSSTFLAIGARSVLGSLWPIPSGRNTVHLTYQINHHLAQGLPIADALRRAQLWMLNPNREYPSGMPDMIARLPGRTPHEDTSQWAAFLHMGM